MTKQIINIGHNPNDKSGDPLRVAFDKVNQNFTELYNAVGADVQIPSQTGNTGKYLTTDGTSLSWGTINTTTSSLVNGSYSVSLSSNGQTTFPNQINLTNSGGISFTAGNGGVVNYANNAIVIAPNTIGATQYWYFNNDGSLTAPGNVVPSTTASYDLGTSSVKWRNANFSGSVSISGTGTALNVSQGNIITNQITGTQVNLLSGAYTVGITAGATANYTLTLPTTAGSANQYLKTDGAGNLSWSSVSATTNSLTNGSYSFTLQSQGYLSVPTSQYSTAQMFSNAGVDFYIGTLDSGNYWQFRTSGRLTFPDSTTQTTAYTGAGDGVKYTGILDAYSADFTVTTQQLVLVYPNATARTITLPASPVQGQTVTIKKVASFSSAPWNVVISGNGKNIDAGSSVTITSGWGYVTLVYSTTTSYTAQWWITAASL